MTDKQTKPMQPSPYANQLVLGVKRFAQFSAVEGIGLTEEDERLFAQMERDGLSNDEKRARILATLTKSV